MTEKLRRWKLSLILLPMLFMPFISLGDTRSADGVLMNFEQLADGTIRVLDITNSRPNNVYIYVDGKEIMCLSAGSQAVVDRIAKNYVRIDKSRVNTNGTKIWHKTIQKAEEPVSKPESETLVRKDAPDRSGVEEKPKTPDVGLTRNKTEKGNMTAGYGNSGIDRINLDPFFGVDAVNDYVSRCDRYVEALADAEDRARYIKDNSLNDFLADSQIEITEKKDEIPQIAKEMAISSKGMDSNINLVEEILTSRLSMREQAYEKLRGAVESVEAEKSSGHKLPDAIINYCIMGVVLLLLVVLIIIVIIRKKNNSKKINTFAPAASLPDKPNDDSSIIVRRKTTSILKRQSLDDVIGNPAYLVINAADFTTESAVRNIYIKNTCIKEVYDLYAEDLRDSENPKEDGCMVLGRWVHDEVTDTYDISLETVVFPGDDAIFKEYELNFGGKIKLRIAEKLRKLRRETNLQYDLVCWIHSHPGLGVFFSNSDENVQTQLKHVRHPHFLIAFVVDILTPNQDLGIFTFRRDGNINSKNDLTKLYSLEEMYKWALKSGTAALLPENYYDVLSSAKLKLPECKGIELNNSAIIDLTRLLATDETGVIGWALGSTEGQGEGQEYVVTSIVSAGTRSSAGAVGVVLNETSFSLPTTQRLISNIGSSVKFVMVYSSKQMTITSIPIINGEVLTDEQFYANELIDNLKIWTRRKR